MKPSILFRISSPGTNGRKLCRNLNDDRVGAATLKSKDINHRIKFMSPANKLKTWEAMEQA